MQLATSPEQRQGCFLLDSIRADRMYEPVDIHGMTTIAHVVVACCKLSPVKLMLLPNHQNFVHHLKVSPAVIIELLILCNITQEI